MTHNTVPDWLTGVWRRLSIETGDGFKDTTTQVIWLQTHLCFGDIRIPADRPNLTSQLSLTELTEPDAIALSHQQGFAGITELREPATCQWHRYIDYQPFNGQRDIGTLSWEGDILIEEGVDSVYKEEWQRVDDGGNDFTALVVAAPADAVSNRPSWQGCLVVAGDHFVYVWNRSRPLPAADSLTSLITNPVQTPDTPVSYLDCEISFGVCRSGIVPWEIQLSTVPWRQGQSLWSMSDLTIEPEQGYVNQQIKTPEGEGMRRWNIHEWGTGLVFQDRL